ncbi:discoidin domain-containing protein [Streptomyces johnsoniae]|uniref:Discoidin domain-containing protein n=1 Tax=Streptomyces johnsoniae TaxID=3075532 RepID=A0ABU2SBK7_9ACTN|nr:discoidin domain-containing protein [Streptomyces sp. DSM 41886]MDT0446363.1 discoidin domain-containing protein [Streptomyces sp. DSM 41886]
MRHIRSSRRAPRSRGRLRAAVTVLAAGAAVLAVPAAAQAAAVQITPDGSAVTASTSDGNAPANAVDDDYGTRWSGEGDGAWLELDLGSTMTVSHIKLAVHQGTARQNVFELQYWDGSRWVTVYEGETSGATNGLESFAFEPVQTSKVRYLGHGYTGDGEGDWNSLTEVEVWGTPGDDDGETPPDPPEPPGRTIEAGTAEELTDALADAEPGDRIELEPGDYTGTFDATASGTAEQPITLTGPRDAVLSNDDGYGLHLDGADHWNLTGFAVADSAKGIVLDESDHVTIDGVEVYNTESEAVRLRAASSDNVIRDSFIHDTGLEEPQYGEGIYIGSFVDHWDDFGEDGGEGPDRSDANQVLNNTIGPDVTAEAVDIKEGTTGGVISGNTFDGDGISGENYADSWMDLKGNGYLIASNTGTFGGDGELLDGYQTHDRVEGWGCGNTFRTNDSDLGGADGYAINVTNQDECEDAPNVVTSDNTVTDAGSGLTNIDVTD